MLIAPSLLECKSARSSGAPTRVRQKLKERTYISTGKVQEGAVTQSFEVEYGLEKAHAAERSERQIH